MEHLETSRHIQKQLFCLNGIQEVVSSILISSTSINNGPDYMSGPFL